MYCIRVMEMHSMAMLRAARRVMVIMKVDRNSKDCSSKVDFWLYSIP